jgi:hypothetical protein
MRHAAIASSVLSLAAAGLLAGCPDRSISEVDPAQGRVEAKDIPVNVTRDVDILFLIDDSPSMKDKQINLVANFPNFIAVLSSIPGGLPNVHIGVVTSDLGSKGADGMIAPGIGVGAPGGCSGFGKAGNMQLFGAPVSGGPYISDIQPIDPTAPRTSNYTGSLDTVFAQMAQAGASGCGFEQHLEAMKQALQPTNVVNQGFLRADAYLAVIFIADEDDCSMEHTTLLGPESTTLGPPVSFRCTRFGVLCDNGGSTTSAMNQIGPKTQCHPNDSSPYLTKVSGYVDFLKKLKSDPSRVIVAGIMGAPDMFETELRPDPRNTSRLIPALKHSCTYIGGDGKPEVADPPIRLKAFLDQFPNRSTFAPICQKDLSGGLQQIADLLKTVLGDPCIDGKLADVDPTTPGPQYDCSVSSVTTDPATGLQTEVLMPKCNPDDGSGATAVCWHLVADPANCTKNDPTSQHISLKFELKDMLPKDSHIVANCVTEVTNN